MFKSVSSEEARKIIAENAGREDFILLDIRTPREFSAGSLPRAVNLNFYSPDLIQRLNALEKSHRYFIFCRSGSRSKGMLEIMEQLGFEEVVELDEGIMGF